MTMESVRKPMLTIDQQIEHLKSKGVTFSRPEEAKDYLRYNNNYFKLTSYRKNYEKYQGGINDGKYIKLDFEFLRDLAVIDMELRYALGQMSLDIEHYAKLKIFRMAEEYQEDGYQICEDFFDQLSDEQRERLNSEISRNKDSVYCGDLFAKYPDHFPVWVFLEMIPFGRLISFYEFCAKRYHAKEMNVEYYLLLACREVRNAAAHSSCILNDLHPGTLKHETSQIVMEEIAGIKKISKDIRKKRMSNERMRQIVTLLYTHNKMVTSKGVHEKTAALLGSFDKRMMSNISYYSSNDLIRGNFDFLHKIIDNWFLNRYYVDTRKNV